MTLIDRPAPKPQTLADLVQPGDKVLRTIKRPGYNDQTGPVTVLDIVQTGAERFIEIKLGGRGSMLFSETGEQLSEVTGTGTTATLSLLTPGLHDSLIAQASANYAAVRLQIVLEALKGGSMTLDRVERIHKALDSIKDVEL